MLKTIMLVQVLAIYSPLSPLFYAAVCFKPFSWPCVCGIVVVGPDYTPLTDFHLVSQIQPLNSFISLSFANPVLFLKGNTVSHGTLLVICGIIGSYFVKFTP